MIEDMRVIYAKQILVHWEYPSFSLDVPHKIILVMVQCLLQSFCETNHIWYSEN